MANIWSKFIYSFIFEWHYNDTESVQQHEKGGQTLGMESVVDGEVEEVQQPLGHLQVEANKQAKSTKTLASKLANEGEKAL
jgi:hypothetical protein